MNKLNIKGLFRDIALLLVFMAGFLSILATTGNNSSRPLGAFACAGEGQVVKTGDRVQLDGRCSTLTESAADDAYLTYNWTLITRPAGSLVSVASRLPNPVFIAEDDGVYEFEVRVNATTPNLKPDFDNVTIVATPDNENARPVADANLGGHYKIGDSPLLDGSRSYDADDDLLTFEWTLQEPLSSGVQIIGDDQVKPVFTTPEAGSYVFELKVDDGITESFNSLAFIKVTNSSTNACPVAIAGTDQHVSTGTLVTLNDSGSSDADQDQLTLNWRIIWRPEGSSAELTNALDSATTSFTADVAGVYLVQLKAYDSTTIVQPFDRCSLARYDTRDTVMVIASDGNSAPKANAGSDQSVDTDDTVQLNAGASTDYDDDPLTYAWEFVSVPASSTAVLSDVSLSNPTYVADQAGSYLVKLNVSDGLLTDSDNMVVTVTDIISGPTRPVANAGDDQTVTTADTIQLDGSGSSDPNNDLLNFDWSFIDWPGAPAGTAPLLSDNTSEMPTFTTIDAGDYVLSLVVNDGVEDSIADTVTITVQAAGSCPDPLNLVTGLPFQPGLGEVATVIQINGDDMTVVANPDTPQDIDAIQTHIPDPMNFDQANFIVLGPAWTETSRTHANPVSDSETISLVIQRSSDSIYYSLDIDFTGVEIEQEVQIDSLTGCRCGNNVGDCP